MSEGTVEAALRAQERVAEIEERHRKKHTTPQIYCDLCMTLRALRSRGSSDTLSQLTPGEALPSDTDQEARSGDDRRQAEEDADDGRTAEPMHDLRGASTALQHDAPQEEVAPEAAGSSDTRLTEALREIVDAADGLTHVSVNVGTVDEHVRAIRMTTAIEAGRAALAAARAEKL